MKEAAPGLFFVASLLLAAWLYIKPPRPPGPPLAPSAYVQQFPTDDPLHWMDEYWSERHAERIAKQRKWVEVHPQSVQDTFVCDPGRSLWPHLDAEGNTSDV